MEICVGLSREGGSGCGAERGCFGFLSRNESAADE